MLLIKYTIILMCFLAILIPIAICLMLRMKHSFENQRKMVINQYPSLFHHNGMDGQS